MPASASPSTSSNPRSPTNVAPAATHAAATPDTSDTPDTPRSTRYDTLVASVARELGLDAKLLHAMIRVESAYDANAVSPKGATGLMQVIPATGARFGFRDLRDPHANLRAGATYLKWLLGEFDDDLTLALAAYNAGEGAVRKYRDQIPPYRETQAYVRQVLACYRGACSPPDDTRFDGEPRAAAQTAFRAPAASRASPRLTAGALLAKLGGLLLSTPEPRPR
ncbi:peptidoglycan N-acetylmuramoylhydrolase [Burkholderia sp. ABCPW 14]|uniref:lytic transglycosylase domain-containing protein n=1 Tax=Burkholderia sp. ABCPW 14 TaxID=1637860 RepID=UPI000770C68E|nr:lytic transglycosylase domain-containing protein [Burkholderia sp. ABCPW 14]KVD74274.1 peptidoglycan N-acetylmuramoylhydrolase [Burkholderia sp. ABCPW 14]